MMAAIQIKKEADEKQQKEIERRRRVVGRLKS